MDGEGVQDKGSVYDYSNLIQHASVGNNQYREIRIESHLGDGDDKVFFICRLSQYLRR